MILRETAKDDKVNHPNHYTSGDIETIDYIRDKLTPEEYQGYCVGNVMKYTSRWRKKDGVQDLEKAAVYLQWAIESAKKQQNAEAIDIRPARRSQIPQGI